MTDTALVKIPDQHREIFEEIVKDEIPGFAPIENATTILGRLPEAEAGISQALGSMEVVCDILYSAWRSDPDQRVSARQVIKALKIYEEIRGLEDL